MYNEGLQGMKNAYTFFILVFFLVLPLHAQQIFGLTYDICVPILDTKEHVSNISFVGFGLDARQMMNEKVSFGVTFHWNSFKDDRLEKVDTGEGSFIAIDDRTLESFPISIFLVRWIISDRISAPMLVLILSYNEVMSMVSGAFIKTGISGLRRTSAL
jgi:hypothetical protein